jgi:hypothetical protein
VSRSGRGPFLVRMSGLCADALDTGARELLAPRVAELDRAEERLAQARAALVEALYRCVPGAEPALRPFLLAVKRQAFNGKPLGPLAGDPRWPELDGLLAGKAADLVALEEEVAAVEVQLARAHAREREREGAHLRRLLDDPNLKPAIAIASRDLLASTTVERGEERGGRRKQARTDVSLLRYLSRAAFKLSPFATLTRIGLGETAAMDGTEGIALAGHDRWEEHSLFRTRRDLLDGVAALLVRHPAVQARLEVSLNDTLKEESPGVFRLIRPMQFTRDEATGELAWAAASFIRVRLDGPVPRWLLNDLPGRSRPFGELLGELGLRFYPEGVGEEDAADLAGLADQLLSLGFLQLVAPWPSHSARLEATLLAYLDTLPGEEWADPVRAALRGLLSAEDGYRFAPDPAAAIGELDRAVRGLADAFAVLFPGIDPMPPTVDPKYNFYQDVFLTGGGGAVDGARGDRAADPAVVRLPAATVREVVDCGDVLWRFGSFFHPQWSFQHALAALVARRWPEAAAGGSVELLDAFGEARPLWKEYVKWLTAPGSPSFDPYGLPAVARLDELRHDLRRRIGEAVGDAEVVPVDALRALAEEIPAGYDPAVGCCLYVQPADEDGRLWVLNRLFEGTGRFGSRFTVAMPPAVAGPYVAAFTAASRFAAHGETVELLDVLYAHENTVNLHRPQTPRVLIVPGEQSDLPRERQVRLSELRLSIDPGSGLPVIRDAAGLRVLPCHMTPANGMHMPVLAKFLAALGPSSGLVELVPGHLGVRCERGMIVAGRLTFGPLVFRRRRWVFPASLVGAAGRSAVEAYRHIPAWFRERGLPDAFYAIERVSRPDSKTERFKPQYVDLGSPAFVELLAGILDRQAEITIEEALPGPGAYPRDAGGRRWGLEVMLDSLVLDRGEPGADREGRHAPLAAGAVRSGEFLHAR